MTAKVRWTWAGVAIAFAVLFTWWAYRDFTTTFFAFDDFWILDAADRVYASGSWWRVFVPTHGLMQYRPLTTVGWFTLQRVLWDVDPAGYYRLHLAIHALNVVLAFAIGRRLLRSPAAGLAVAVVYATAPGHAIAARWLAQIIMALTATLYFVGLLLWLRPSRWRGVQASVVLALGLLASEHAVTLPIAWTVLVLLGPERWAPRAAMRALAGPWLIAGAYVAAKAWYATVVMPRDPLRAAVFWKGYAVDLAPRTLLETLGRYLANAVDLLYGIAASPGQSLALGVALVAAAALGTLVVVVGRAPSRALRVTVVGLVLFGVGMGPVGLMPSHFSSAYVGIAALGSALALIGSASMVPRIGGAAALAIAAVCLALYGAHTRAELRRHPEIHVLDVMSLNALAWLSTLDHRTAGGDVREVLVPDADQNRRLFGAAHRLFLCARYDVRAVPPKALVPAPHRLVLTAPEPLAPERRSTAWLRARCPSPAAPPPALSAERP